MAVTAEPNLADIDLTDLDWKQKVGSSARLSETLWSRCLFREPMEVVILRPLHPSRREDRDVYESEDVRRGHPLGSGS